MEKHVCLFCETWESGGIEAFLYNVLSHMDLDGLKIDLVTAQLDKSVFTDRLQQLGIRFIELSGNPRRLWENHRRFKALLEKRQYDIVHLNLYHGASLYYAKLSADAGVSMVVAHSHNTALRRSWIKSLKLAVHHTAKKRFARYATDLWACSQDAAEFLFPKGLLRQKGVTFIPDGIDIERFRFNPAIREEIRQELGVKGKLVIGNVGRLCYQKNQVFLLEVLAELRKERTDTVLLLVGEGKDRRILEEKAKRLNVTESVIFYGTTNHVEQMYWVMDVFAFPSRFEGLGIAALEAQSAGLPVVCSQNMPLEVRVTDLVEVISLTEGGKRWAKVLLEAASKTRKDTASQVAALGFGIHQTAAGIRSSYLGLGK